jgi:(2R)-ethylmalonyl-CoA mutase
MDIAYEGIRLTPEQIIASAIEQKPHVIGLSILSGSHLPLVADLMDKLAAAGLSDIPVIVGGIIPDSDADTLCSIGVAKVYTPKDFALNTIMMDIVELCDPLDSAA